MLEEKKRQKVQCTFLIAHRAFVPSLSGHEFIGQRIVVVVVVVGFCSGTEDVIKSNPGTSKLTVQILGTLKVA